MDMNSIFADDVGTPIFEAIESGEAAGKMLLLALILFAISLVSLVVISILVRRKIYKGKPPDDYIELK